jgi:ATP-dependent exoDNAse (exonuclease V) beta subunit
MDYEKLARFRERLHGWRARRDSVTFDRLLLAALDDCGYRAESGARGDANIEKFLAQARAASGKMTLDEYVDDLAQARRKDPRERDAPLDDSVEAVKIMTAHAAKGLEFPVVFVSAIHKGVKKDLEAVEFSPRVGIGARWRNPASGQPKDDLFLHAIRDERETREGHEADRLLYVAMTRAEEHLALTFSGRKHDQWDKTVIAATHLDTETPADEVVAMRAPDGAEWNLRKMVVNRPPQLLRNEAAAMSEDATEWLEPPEPSDLHDANATVTALSQFSRCPRAYYLGNYLGFEGRRRGSVERDGVELDDDPPEDLPADEIGRQTHGLLAGMPVENPHPEALKLAEVFRKSALGARASRATRVEREFDFLMRVEDLVVRGQIDLWFEEGGELVIVDYKTDAVNGVEAHERAHGYGLQLRLYALAVERVAGRPVDRAWLHFLRPDKTIEVDIAPSLLESPESAVREFLEAQDRGEFPLREGAQCKSCEFYRGLCPAQGIR